MPAGLALHGWRCTAGAWQYSCDWTTADGGVAMRKELAGHPQDSKGAAAGLCLVRLTHSTGVLIQITTQLTLSLADF